MSALEPPRKPAPVPASLLAGKGPADRVLIIADDLTGTLDAVAALVDGAGAPFVGFSAAAFAQAPSDAVCIAINTNTRHHPPAEARRIVADLARRALAQGIGVVFKKTDSTLRGNIAAELAGLADAAGSPPVLVFAPGFPEAGRTVRDGVLRVDGVEVSRTAFGSDPRSPAQQSHVPALLSNTFAKTALRLAPLPTSTAPAWFEGLAPGCNVFDSETPDDLDRLARALAGARRRPLLLAGSAGLGKRLPLISGRAAEPRAPCLPDGPALILHGSVTPRSLAQIARAKARDALCIELTPEWLWADPAERAVFENAWWLRIGYAFSEGKSVLVHTTAPVKTASDPDPFAPWGRTAADYSREAPFAIARLGRRILELTGYRVLVLGGGETSQAAIEALGATHGRALGEVSIGVNRLAIDALGRPFDVVTKSGGMGPDDLYEHFLP
jgi:uncharacterized protein YgbK (DUF1537 family)